MLSPFLVQFVHHIAFEVKAADLFVVHVEFLGGDLEVGTLNVTREKHVRAARHTGEESSAPLASAEVNEAEWLHFINDGQVRFPEGIGVIVPENIFQFEILLSAFASSPVSVIDIPSIPLRLAIFRNMRPKVCASPMENELLGTLIEKSEFYA